MTITKVFRSDVVAGVPARWTRQYGNHPDMDSRKAIIGRALRDLPDGFTADQVDKIIGNKSWTRLDCDECGKTCDELIRIGEEPDYEARWVDICADCLRLATTVSKPTDQTKEG